jgi:hypothetical protein
LDFFRHVAGPVLSGQCDTDFWTCLVAQFSHREPAVQHALVAISSLYEHGMQSSFAVRHYNAAIQKTVSSSDETLVLLMVVLFICVEFLKGDAPVAIDHCRHGILILNKASTLSTWAREYLLPIFSRLSIFPLFFGGDIVTFPLLEGLDTLISTSFSNFTDAQSSIHALMARSIRFVRFGDKYRLGVKRHSSIPRTLRKDQDSLIKSLDDWQSAFSEFKTAQSQSDTDAYRFNKLEMSYLLCKIWVSVALELDEIAYDKHHDSFRLIMDMASEIITIGSSAPENPSRPKFIFEMGFLPILYFVAMKCRILKIRLVALSYMEALSVSREGLWEARTMYCVVSRLIEVEHSIELNDQSSLSRSIDVPPEEKRVKECMLSLDNADMGIQYDENGSKISWMRLTYILRKPPDKLYMQNEWISASSKRSIREDNTNGTRLDLVSRFMDNISESLS